MHNDVPLSLLEAKTIIVEMKSTIVRWLVDRMKRCISIYADRQYVYITAKYKMKSADLKQIILGKWTQKIILWKSFEEELFMWEQIITTLGPMVLEAIGNKF